MRTDFDDAFAQGLGLEFPAPDEVRMAVRPEHINGVDKLLGPIAFALVDYAMTGAAAKAVAEDEVAITVNIAINFVDSAGAGEVVVATAAVARRTRTVLSLTADLRDAGGRVLATAIGTFAIRPAR